MPRVSHVVASLKRKKRIFKKTKGFWGGRSRLYRTAIESLRRSMVFAYRDRKDRKGDFRQLWIVRINAACGENNISYSRFINGLKKANVKIDRKMLAELAVSDKTAFAELVKIAKGILAAQTVPQRPKKAQPAKHKTTHQVKPKSKK
jgi:large subunit ribosomal protein L20